MSTVGPEQENGGLDLDVFAASLTGAEAVDPDAPTRVEHRSTADPDDGTLLVFPADDAKKAAEPTPAAKPAPGAGGDRWAGRTMGKFRLLRQLGQGSMGVVLQAEDTHLGRLVALKVLQKHVAGMTDEVQVQQFLREARAAAQLDHPHVARVHEIDRHNGWWYIATEYLEGGSIRQLVKATGPLAPHRACPLIADAASALAVAHQRGMIHRDVKPANLMLTRTGRAKLVDFGLVRLEDPEDLKDFTDSTVGTPHYLAPELALKKPVTPAADVYSLGATLFCLLAGRPPFRGKKISDILRQHIEAPRPDLAEHVPGCSDSLAVLLVRMMAVNPADRPPMEEVAASLRAETIGPNPEDTDLALLTAADGSSVMASVGPERFGSRTGFPPGAGSASAVADASMPPARPWWAGRTPWILAASVLLAALLVVAGVSWLGAPAVPADPLEDRSLGRAAFEGRFPDAPASYGLRPAGDAFDPAAGLATAPAAE